LGYRRMTNRERVMAVLNYRDYDRMPIMHFGFWGETLRKWADEGHLTPEEAQKGLVDGSAGDMVVSGKLGFDGDYYSTFGPNTGLSPAFEREVVEELADGSMKVLNASGMIVIEKPDAGSIPAEVDHLLKGRKEWEELYLPKLQFDEARFSKALVNVGDRTVAFDDGGLDYLKSDDRQELMGLHCGSLFGQIRNWLGLQGVSYMYADDLELYDEIIDTVGELCYRVTKSVLESGARFDYAHFWEDICFKNGPLVIPRVFDEKVGPHYKRITELTQSYGLNICSLDCDGKIDALVPTWIANGVNTMFPIEVGTWNADIAPWRELYGKELRGVGGMRKQVFAEDFASVDAEIARLAPLVELGGFIPCPDHRIPPNAQWDNVRYYCDRMRAVFS